MPVTPTVLLSLPFHQTDTLLLWEEGRVHFINTAHALMITANTHQIAAPYFDPHNLGVHILANLARSLRLNQVMVE